MNEITMLTNADPLIRMALDEDITSEDISTNAVMREMCIRDRSTGITYGFCGYAVR